MATFMTQWSYTKEAWGDLIPNPVDREEAVRSLIEDQLGGRLLEFYFSFGEYDGIAIYEAEDPVTAAAGAIAASLPGHLEDTNTTVLLDTEERMEALKKASEASFSGPA